MGMLGISLTGLMAFQRALDVTGHNIANANTPGYSRQNVNLVARPGIGSSQVVSGNGTSVADISRSYDSLLVKQYQTATSGVGRLETLDSLTGRLNSLLSDPDTGLNNTLLEFFGSVQDLSNDPSSVPTRQAMIGQAEGLVSRFRSADQQLASLGSEVNERLRQAVSEINNIAVSIADLNNKVASAGIDADSNDLLDQRDQLVLKLSGLVAVQTTLQDDGSLNVFIGSGQGLVIGSTPQQLAVRGGEFDATELSISYAANGVSSPIDSALNGGTLGGLLEFRNSILAPARETLGQTAAAFALSFNEQHRSGMDLRGSIGSDFFSIAPPGVLYSENNTGTASATTSFTDLGQMTGNDYLITYDGVGYNVFEPGSSVPVPFTGTGTALDPLEFAGLSVTMSGTPGANDRFLIRSGRDIAASMSNVITDPQSIAAAAATRSVTSLSNLGNANISPARTVDATDVNFLSTTTIQFLDASTYSVNGAGSFAYVDGDPIVLNGSEITITGIPNVGDQFVIEPNFGATGDNANGLLLGDIQSVDILEGGTISVNENYGRLVSEVGSTTNQVVAGLGATKALQLSAQNEVLSVSGVNLDEEAARLVQYQQAYQASAQVITVAAQLFDTVLGMVRR